MAVFLDVHGLLELEQSEKWYEATHMLYSLWNKDRNNVDKLCRLISECWYVLSEWDCIQSNGLSFDTFKKVLAEATQYGLKHFDSNPDFLWLTGYMISLFPYLFYEDDSRDSYIDWEQRGKEMLLRSTQLAPDNLIARVFWLGSQCESAEYLAEKSRLALQLNNDLFGKTAIETYFNEILSC